MTRTRPQSCIGCSLYHKGTDFSQIEGTGSSGIMLVGEASGVMEAREELPFRPHAPAGSVLERILRRMSLDRQMFSITNACRCHPPHDYLADSPWEFSALSHCRPNLGQAIRERKPRVLVALGGIATRELTQLSGEQLGIGHLAGYVMPYYRLDAAPLPTVANFHPSYLRRGKASHQGVVARILQRAVNISRGNDRQWLWEVDPDEPSTWGDKQYVLHPSVDEAIAFRNYVRDNPQIPIAEDIETPESAAMDEDAREGFRDTEIRQIQFSMGRNHGIAMQWREPFRSIAVEILHSRNPKYGHNWLAYDHKVLRAAAAREGWTYAPTVPVLDTLDMFHHWQPDLPAHLQFASSFIQFEFPWKHMHTIEHEPFYGCCDVEADWRLGEMLVATLKRDGLWGDSLRGYVGQVQEFRPVLAAMEDRGIPIDDIARLRLDSEFDIAQRELHAEIKLRVPRECLSIDPKQGLKKFPAELKDVPETEWTTRRFQDSPKKQKDGALKEGEWSQYAQREFPVAVVDAQGNPAVEQVTRWCRIYEFNPNSGDQLIEYMKAKKHKVPKSKDEDAEGNQKDTTNEKSLRRLANTTGDDFYLKVIGYRGFTKLRGTYIEGFKPGTDGRVHSTFNPSGTAIGQLSSKNPNAQNFSKLKPTIKLAKALRSMVCAEYGMILTEWDYKSFHVLTLGYLAEDPLWMRLARMDMHSFVAGHVLGLWDGTKIVSESDEQLMTRFRWLKSDPERKRIRDDQAKHAGLGIGNGLMAKGLYERYMENFPPKSCPSCRGSGEVMGVYRMKKCPECSGSRFIPGQRVAQQFLDALQQLAPKIFAYHKSERQLAHEHGDRGVITPYLFARRFYEVYTFNKRWNPDVDSEPPHGDQAEQAVSFRHTNIAHCHMRQVMKDIHYSGLAQKYGMFNQIHDALKFHFRKDMLEEHIREIFPVMYAPSQVLKHPVICPQGLVVDVEASWGRRWSEMEEIDLKGIRNAHANANPNPNPQPADLALVLPPSAVVAAAQ